MMQSSAMLLKLCQTGAKITTTASGGGISKSALFQTWRLYGMGSHVSDNDPDVIDRATQRHLKGKTVSCIEDAPGWEEFLASDSEAVVKAERSKNKSMKEMQEDTVHYLKEEDECDAASAAAAAPQPSK